MKPLIILLFGFLISIFTVRVIQKEYDLLFSARIAMALMLCFTAIGHFAFTKGMVIILPKFIPFKWAVIYLTGILEVSLAFGLLVPKFKTISGWALIIALILMLPANIYASLNHVNYEKATFDGNGISYLWFRIPLQFLFIVWVYVCSIREF